MRKPIARVRIGRVFGSWLFVLAAVGTVWVPRKPSFPSPSAMSPSRQGSRIGCGGSKRRMPACSSSSSSTAMNRCAGMASWKIAIASSSSGWAKDARPPNPNRRRRLASRARAVRTWDDPAKWARFTPTGNSLWKGGLPMGSSSFLKTKSSSSGSTSSTRPTSRISSPTSARSARAGSTSLGCGPTSKAG